MFQRMLDCNVRISVSWAASASGVENNLDRMKYGVLYLICLREETKMKPKSLMKLSRKEPVKLEPLGKFASIPKELKKSAPEVFKAVAVVDKKGSPRYFIFDTYALWDLLCAFDAKLEENVSPEEYVFRNPVGWLIDAIESHLPINPKLAARLRKGIKEAEKLGLVPFEKIKSELGLS